MFVLLGKIAISQADTVDIKSSTVNDHILMLLETKPKLKDLLIQDFQGERSIFITPKSNPELEEHKPFNNGDFKTHFWSSEMMFFYSASCPCLEINQISNNKYETSYKMTISTIDNGSIDKYFIDVVYRHYDRENNKRIQTVIDKLEIRKK